MIITPKHYKNSITWILKDDDSEAKFTWHYKRQYATITVKGTNVVCMSKYCYLLTRAYHWHPTFTHDRMVEILRALGLPI